MDGKTVEQKIAELKNDHNVEYAQPNYRYYTQATSSAISSNDTYKDNLWGLNNHGQTVSGISGILDADVDAPEAWAINEGTNATTSVIVAVIDTGVAYNHPDLLLNMWDGANCVSDTNTVLGNCNYGYDYEDDDKTPLPSLSHGTHVAGTIAAVKGNAKGIIGLAPHAKIMALKTSLTTSEIVKSINFAKYNGAKVINASWGGPSFDQAMKTAIDAFPGIFVAAAGNDSSNNEVSHNYPSDFNSSNIISVAATNQNDALATFSNYGAISVDVGAPGTTIYSTIPGTTTALFEDFESVVPPAVPDGWIRATSTGTSTWQTHNPGANIALYGDLTVPYANNASTTITSPLYDFSGVSSRGANISFDTQCDTEYTPEHWSDYMAFEVSGDGSAFTTILQWDEADLDSLTGDSSDVGSSALYLFDEQPIPSEYLTANFKFRFKWFTDATVSSDRGCLVDNVRLTTLSDGSDEKYDYLQGTSMAAPHVAGLAALIMGYNPTLTIPEVKNAILNTGDSLSSLSGETVTGKRINAHSALLSVAPSSVSTVTSGTYTVNDGGSTITGVPHGTSRATFIAALTKSESNQTWDTSGLSDPVVSDNTLLVTAQNGTTTKTYTLTVALAKTTKRGGGGGGGSRSPVSTAPVATTTSVLSGSQMTDVQIQDLLVSLYAQLNTLIAQLNVLAGREVMQPVIFLPTPLLPVLR